MGSKPPNTSKTPLTVKQAQHALEAEGKFPPAQEEAGAPQARVPSDVPLTDKGLAEIKTLNGKVLSLGSHPITPAAVVLIQELLTKDEWTPDQDGVRRDNRLWDMFRARARNQRSQLDTAVAKEVYESRKTLRTEAQQRYNRREDGDAPKGSDGNCTVCERDFVLMIRNLVIGGEVQTYKGQTGKQIPKLTGNFIQSFAGDKYVPTAICDNCLRQYREINRGSDLDTNGYPFQRCEELCGRLNERVAKLAGLAANGAKRKHRGEWRGDRHSSIR